MGIISTIRKSFYGIILIAIICLGVLTFYFESQVGVLQGQNSTLKSEKDELEAKNRELLNQLALFQNNSSSLHDQVARLQEQAIDLQTQNGELQNILHNYTGKVFITNFTTQAWGNPAGMVYDKRFNVTVTNSGTSEISNLTITFTILGNVSNLGNIFAFYPQNTEQIDR